MAKISDIPQGISEDRYKKVKGLVSSDIVEKLVGEELSEKTRGRLGQVVNIRRREGVLTGKEDSSAIPVYPDVNREREPWLH